MTKTSKLRIDLLIGGLLVQLLWTYCLWQWLAFVLTTPSWLLLSAFLDYAMIASVFFLLAFFEYLIAYVMYAGFRGKNLWNYN